MTAMPPILVTRIKDFPWFLPFVIPHLSTKRRREGECATCGSVIEVGEQFVDLPNYGPESWEPHWRGRRCLACVTFEEVQDE